MKKVRVILSLVAFVFAIGAAIAFGHPAPNTVAYQFIPSPAKCELKMITCQVTETLYPCRQIVGSPILHEDNDVETSCGRALWRTTPPPAQ
jgi:hypothetical protein